MNGDRSRRVNAIRGGILLAAAAALIGGGVLVTQQSGSHPAAAPAGPAAVVNGQRVDLDNGVCNDIHQQIKDKKDVNVAQAEQCDQQEFEALVKDGKVTELSETCQLVNDRARTGDAELLDSGRDLVGLGFNCRQRERAINAALGQKKITALCDGAKILQDSGDKNIDASDLTACTAEGATQNSSNDIRLTPQQPEDLTTDQSSNDGGDVTKCTVTSVAPGGTTASGEENDPNALTAGSNTFDIGTKIRIFNPRTKQDVVVTVNDKNGSFCAALSQRAFEQVRDQGLNLIRDAQVSVVK